MKRLGVILLAVFASAAVQPVQADDKATTKDAQESGAVTKADKAFSNAVAKSDAKEFDSLTSDDYVLTSSGGNLWDKAKNLDAFKEGSLKFDSIDNEEEKVHLYDNTAVVTGLSKIKGKYKDHEFDDSYRWTRVWVQRDGKWLCVAEQMSKIQPPAETPKPKDK